MDKGRELTDVELTKLCAEAMGKRHWPHHRLKDVIEVSDDGTGRNAYIYTPLHDDAQAMALVKRFKLDIHDADDEGTWEAWGGPVGVRVHGASDDLNRAICLCVARMQSAPKPGG